MTVRFGDFEVDPGRYELRQDGARVHVEPKVFDLIAFLVGTGGRLVTRDEIVDAVWGGRIVSEATVSGSVKAARKALGDAGREPQYIQTVRGRGFRFTAEVASQTGAASQGAASTSSEAFLPSLGIAGFEVIGAGDKGALAGRALASNLAVVLSRVPLLAIIADAQRMQPAYLIDGNVQQSGDDLLVTVQLSESRNGFRLWAHEFRTDGEAGLDSTLVREVVARLEPQLVRAIFNDCSDGSGDLGSRQLLLQALGVLAMKGWHKDTFAEATGLLRQSVALEPGLALAHGHLSLLLALGHRIGILRENDGIVEDALRTAETALSLETMDSNVLGVAGCALCDVGQSTRGMPLLQQSIDLNAYNGQAWTALGAAHLSERDPAKAIPYLSHGVAISPADSRLSAWGAILAVAHLASKDFENAVEAARVACAASDRTYLPRIAGAAANLGIGREDDARALARDALRIKPDLSENEVRYLIGRKWGTRVLSLLSAMDA